MNFLCFPIFCVLFLPTRANVLFSLLRSPESLSDKLDVKFDGSIDLGNNWKFSDVRDSINKLRQGLGLDDKDTESLREVQWNKEDISDSRQQNKWAKRNKVKGKKFWASSGLVEHYKHDISDKRDSTSEISDNQDTVDKVDKKVNLQWDDPVIMANDNIQRKGIQKERKKEKIYMQQHGGEGIVGVTQVARTKTTDHKVKDDERTMEFSVHVFKQAMRVFDSIKRKTSNSEMKKKIDEMSRSYKDQFGDFVRQQRDTSVRTKMGDQRVILHTMDTSNSIMQRLVNFLKADMEEAETDKSGIGKATAKTVQKEVDIARQLEYKHVCTKYGYCRSDAGFTTMLKHCIKTIINVDDEKMYRARDAITEVLQHGDYSKLIDSKTEKTYKSKISKLEKKEPKEIREGLRALLGMLNNAQTPLVVEGENTEVVKKTAAFYTLLAMYEDNMPSDETNKLEWSDIENSLGDWSAGKRTDILDIIKALERNMQRGLDRIDPDTEVKMKEQVKIIRG